MFFLAGTCKMSEGTQNGLAGVSAIKSEPVDDNPEILKGYLTNGVCDDDEVEDIHYFTQTEVDNTRRCLENTRLIIKDFETQLDWHLQQYMVLRTDFNKGNKDEPQKRQDLLSISQLSALIANHPEGNKNFIKRKGSQNGSGGKRKKNQESETEDSDYSDEDSDDDDMDINSKLVPKDEIEEEEHELVEPKVENESDDDEDFEEMGVEPPKKTVKVKTEGKRGKSKDKEDVKPCTVVLNRMNDDSVVEVKDEEMDKDELVALLQEKAIEESGKFETDPEKPIVILKEDNFEEFDYKELRLSNVIITYEDKENLPEFVFIKKIADYILNDQIALIKESVFDQLEGEQA